jgi:hypothetical protein
VAVPVIAAAPTITSFTPTQGPIGANITVTGTALTGATSVKIGGAIADFHVASATKIVATAPATATGKIVVVTPGGTATSSATFTVTPGALAAPAQTHPSASITVTASGMDPYTSMDVFFDTTDVALTVSNGRGIASVTITVPANAAPVEHWITFDERSNHKAVQAPVTINTDWLQGNYGFNGAGFNPYEGTLDSASVPTLDALWAKPNSPYSNQLPMVESNGTVFVNDTGGTIRAYSATGALVWTASPGGFMSNRNPVIYGSKVYFSNQTNVFAYSVTCGKAGATCTPLWTAAVNSNNGTGLTQYNGMLYIGGSDGSVYPIDPATGALGTPFSALPQVGEGGIITPVAFNADGGYAYGTVNAMHVDYGNGSKTRLASANVVGGIALMGNLGYYETSEGVLHEVRGKAWTATLSATNCLSTPAVAYGMVFAGDCNYVWGFNAASGAVAWSFPGGSVAGISVANHIVYACASGAIVALNAANGAYLWTGGVCYAAPLVANGIVYSSGGKIYAFTVPSLSPGIARKAPSVAGLRRDRGLLAVRTPERFALSR